MLTNTKCEFWVIMNDHTPAFPGPHCLPFLIDDPETKQLRFEITNPFDNRVKTYQFAATAQAEIERFRKYPDLVNDLKNAYPFKVECSVRIASAGEAGGYFENLPPTEQACAIPKVREHPPFRKVIVKYYGRDGFLTKEKRTIDKFVLWTLTSDKDVKLCPGLHRHLIFFGSESEFQRRWSSEGGARGVIENSYFTNAEEYHRLRLIYRKFKQHPEKFIAKETTHDNF